MAHCVESMFYVKEEPWHGLGTRVEQEVTAEAAMKLAGMDWTVEKIPLYIPGKKKVDGIPVLGKQVPDKFGIVRKTDDRILGVVGAQYKPVQNSECFEFMDSLVGESQAVYHTAGSLDQGRIVWILMKLPKDMKIGPDKIEKYLLLSSSHDGTRALTMRYTPIRVVCKNTLNAAETAQKAEYSIRHYTSIHNRLIEARKALGLADAYYQRMEVLYAAMLKKKFSMADMKKFTEVLLPFRSEKESVQTLNVRTKIESLYAHGTGIADVAGTRWAAYNAVTEYTDHGVKDRSQKMEPREGHFNSVLFGTGAALKQKAFQMLATI